MIFVKQFLLLFIVIYLTYLVMSFVFWLISRDQPSAQRKVNYNYNSATWPSDHRSDHIFKIIHNRIIACSNPKLSPVLLFNPLSIKSATPQKRKQHMSFFENAKLRWINGVINLKEKRICKKLFINRRTFLVFFCTASGLSNGLS